ncbi:unnamed protein product [Protopolystoma xenopodis]|uniref:Uncharacterized protein n=1 Tax=Protopolystoma xenopodis TaxID=117903 RepID=A0A3S5BPF3_9PLAT|nr:unnamed protein product [Protopolystoma xenopodis]
MHRLADIQTKSRLTAPVKTSRTSRETEQPSASSTGSTTASANLVPASRHQPRDTVVNTRRAQFVTVSGILLLCLQKQAEEAIVSGQTEMVPPS